MSSSHLRFEKGTYRDCLKCITFKLKQVAGKTGSSPSLISNEIMPWTIFLGLLNAKEYDWLSRKNSSPYFKTFPRKCSKTGNRTCLLRIWNCFKRQGNDRTWVRIKILNFELKFHILESKCNHSGFKVERNIRRILVPILNRESVSDKSRQWSDSGPIESIHFFRGKFPIGRIQGHHQLSRAISH